ncbi:hypothetical protein BU14_0094s0008 [Porphyra umbilicalis]|uniref:Uncharacterized protein n=1 Tax=Porphyra umbilicalis TaxID=2786 RepID=A0A1X6PDG4_PORUM|nr:hypothetical protein BU14_0094s0008 [Porphyra umbilicalis]|eukprot:OSX78931.1 hypothetical protein BU14_0094s0008 [Porphyra umbilicalis]
MRRRVVRQPCGMVQRAAAALAPGVAAPAGSALALYWCVCVAVA